MIRLIETLKMIHIQYLFWSALQCFVFVTAGVTNFHHHRLIPRNDNAAPAGDLLKGDGTDTNELEPDNNGKDFTNDPIPNDAAIAPTNPAVTPGPTLTTLNQDGSRLNDPFPAVPDADAENEALEKCDKKNAKDGSECAAPHTLTGSDADTDSIPIYRLQINKCQSSQAGDPKCNVATLLIIYPKMCDQENGKLITDSLHKISDRKIYISQDSCGPFLWRVEFTPRQIIKLRENSDVNDAILDIVPDRYLEGSKHPTNGPSDKGQAQKRDDLQRKFLPPGGVNP